MPHDCSLYHEGAPSFPDQRKTRYARGPQHRIAYIRGRVAPRPRTMTIETTRGCNTFLSFRKRRAATGSNHRISYITRPHGATRITPRGVRQPHHTPLLGPPHLHSSICDGARIPSRNASLFPLCTPSTILQWKQRRGQCRQNDNPRFDIPDKYSNRKGR